MHEFETTTAETTDANETLRSRWSVALSLLILTVLTLGAAGAACTVADSTAPGPAAPELRAIDAAPGSTLDGVLTTLPKDVAIRALDILDAPGRILTLALPTGTPARDPRIIAEQYDVAYRRNLDELIGIMRSPPASASDTYKAGLAEELAELSTMRGLTHTPADIVVRRVYAEGSPDALQLYAQQIGGTP